VRTQAPYALTVMAVSITGGYLPCALLGLSPLVGLALCAALIVAVVFGLGRKAEADTAQ
jgi:hypothetical protein